MKKRSKVLALILVASFSVIFASCAEDPYKDYISSGLKAKDFSLGFENDFISSISTNENAMIFKDFESFSAYEFPLDYTEEFFEKNDLLVFVTIADPADQMQFFDILTYEGNLYPCFSRVKLGPNDPLYEDVIVYLLYCAELAKTDDYELGKVIYQYR